ncbi:hypothetical protein EHM69_10325 [candidate division KSB1 bacterium]|nr:MAG: hypothetical protein EHM69_10325 [candidate division KSB1 bacterium]
MNARRLLQRIVFFCATAAVFLFGGAGRVWALEWIYVTPNPAYSRDLSMGASTIALSYAPQSQSINPAGLQLFDSRTSFHGTMLVNAGGIYQIANAHGTDSSRSNTDRIFDDARVLVCAGAAQIRIAALAVYFSQPVMRSGDVARYDNYRQRLPLDMHQNSLALSLALHPQVSVGGRFDRYYEYDTPQGDGYSYGVILRPRGLNVGVQYQRFPAAGAFVWHPLDRRGDETTTAGVAIERETYSVSFQVMNLTKSDAIAFLEPHAGVEWRPLRALTLRAGGMQFSRSPRWAWTGGCGLIDANWLRNKASRLSVPDDILQVSVGMIYVRGVPEQAVGSLTCVWRF